MKAVVFKARAIWLTLICMALFSSGQAQELTVGAQAPEFELVDQHQSSHRLQDYQGKWVVLYFYPKDDTPGCTKEACNFRDDIFAIREVGAEVLGVSVDSSQSHAKFAEKYGLPFPLLVDTGGQVAESYGALWSLGPVRIAKRHTFIIDPQSKIAKIYRSVNPSQHSKEVIAELKQLTTKTNL